MSQLVEEKQITNEVILETINNAENSYLKKSTSRLVCTLVIFTMISTLYLKLIKPI